MNTVIFDLDGTLLPMDTDKFNELYFGELYKKFLKTDKNAEVVMRGIKNGTAAMKTNNGKISNEQIFWHTFEEITGLKRKNIEPIFNDFYYNEFDRTKEAVKTSTAMTEAVKILKDKGYRMIIATDPVFPDFVNIKRIHWAGLDENDFDYITDYSKHKYCKPSVGFYREVLTAIDVLPENSVMIGNNVAEDGGAKDAGINLYLISDCLLNYENRPVETACLFDSDLFLSKVKTLPEVK